MNTTIPPTDPAETIRMWLCPRDETEEAVVAYLVTTMRRQLPTLAQMLSREFREMSLSAGRTGRRECLLAVAEVMVEVHGIETVHETLSGLEGGKQR